MKINGFDGKEYTLSEKVYRLKVEFSQNSDKYRDLDYIEGSLVRLISGCDDSKTPGWHFHPEWVTVCSVNAKQAQLLGFKRSDIEEVRSE